MAKVIGMRNAPMASHFKFIILFFCIFLSGYCDNTLGDNFQSDKKTDQKIGITEIEFQNVKIRRSDADGYELVGCIKNRSTKKTIHKVKIEIRFYDCLTKSGKETCIIIGERKESIYLTIAPNQKSEFKEPVYIYGDLLNSKGDLVWEYDIVSINSD